MTRDNNTVVPKFSVLIPVYNVGKYLRECIDSVLGQSFQDFEIILVDDGSTDESGRICDDYASADGRILVFHQSNAGLLMTRRKAIAEAAGEYLLFLDSDDYWEKNTLESVGDCFYEHDCDMVIFRFRRVGETGSPRDEQDSIFRNGEIFEGEGKRKILAEVVNGYRLNNIVCKAVKRSIVDSEKDYSIFGRIGNGEDLLQSMPLFFNAEKIVYLDMALYNYRLRGNSITSRKNNRIIEDIEITRSVVLRYLHMAGHCSEQDLNKFYSFVIGTLIEYAISTGSGDIYYWQKVRKMKLYQNGERYIDTMEFSLVYRLACSLLKEQRYKILAAYCSLLNRIILMKRRIRAIAS